MFQIMRKEINSFLNSLAAYIVVIVFLIATGLFTWVFPQTSILEVGYATLDPLFMVAPYVLMFLIPAITMRTFAEEKRAGTMELLLTRPITDWHLILGKYFACLLLVGFSILPTTLYYISVYNLGAPQGNIDSAAVAGSYVGLFMLAAVFTAIGIVASSITESQIVAFIIAIFCCYVMYEGFTSIAAIDVWAGYSYIVSQLGIDYHYQSLSKGLIDSRNMLYLFSVVISMLYLSKLILGARKW